MILFYAISVVAVLVGVGVILRNSMDTGSENQDGEVVDTNVDEATPTANPSTTDIGDVVSLVTDTLKDLESYSSVKYEDPPGSGKWSIGYGHQIQRGENFPQYISEDTAIGLLATDVSLAWGCVRNRVRVLLNTNQAAALTSFCFNVGCSAFTGSTMLRKLNAGDYDGAAAEFDVWIYVNHVINQGLVSRRKVEKDLFEA